MSAFNPPGMGWLPDLPDPRDYTCRSEAVLPLLKTLGRSSREGTPNEINLCQGDEGESFFSAPADQGMSNCSSTCAVLGLIEYFERRICGRTFDGSRRFLYKITRFRMQPRLRLIGDTGADLRTTLKMLVQFGVPSEEHWPYDLAKLDEELDPMLYGLAKTLQGVRYFRLDERNQSGAETWDALVSFLASGFPVAFGFPVSASLTRQAEIPLRHEFDRIRGGQPVLAVGYRLDHFGRSQHALKIRNSWGKPMGRQWKRLASQRVCPRTACERFLDRDQ